MRKILILLTLITTSAFAKLDGKGLTVAVIDTGCRVTHVDFQSKIVAVKNFTTDDDGNEYLVDDGWGHGTLITGLIAANGSVNKGIAPEAEIVVLKVVPSGVIGGVTFQVLEQALQWVLDNHKVYNISVVNLSIVGGNVTIPYTNHLRELITQLRDINIPVVCCAGNGYKPKEPVEGMGAPAIFPESLSVGALDVGGNITPYSQRVLGEEEWRTDLFILGNNLKSSGIGDDYDSASASGTSYATGLATGNILLMQQWWLKRMGTLPSVDVLEKAFSYKMTREFQGELYPAFNKKKAFRYLRKARSLVKKGLTLE